MSDLLSGQISFSGLGSGTDFSGIVDQLLVVESLPLNRMQNQRDTFERRVNAVDDIIKVMEEAKNTLAELSNKDNFVKKKLSFTDDSFVTGEASSDAKDGNYRLEVISVAARSSAIGEVDSATPGKDKVYTSKDDKLAFGKDGEFTYSLEMGGNNTPAYETRTINVTEDMTLEQLKHAVNNDPENPGVEMVVSDNGQGSVGISFRSKETGAKQEIIIEDKTVDFYGTSISANVLGIGFDNADKGTDSSYKVDDLLTTSNSNEVVIAEGIEVEFYEVGTTTVSVKTDKEKVKENIQEFLNAINSVLKEIDRHTSLDKIAEEDQEDDEDKSDDALANYLDDLSAPPALTENALTGESGITTLNSRIISTLGGLGLGFERTGPDGKGGDLIGTLTEMGIKINAVEGDPNFGLFEIAPPSSSGSNVMQDMDLQRFDDYIDDNLDDVIDFFVADNKIETSSTGFFHDSSIGSFLEPGIYDVQYKVGSGGDVIGDVLINGEIATQDPDNPRLYTAASTAGGVKALAIQISETAEGTYNESIKIQQGKVNQITELFSAELTPYIQPNVAEDYFPENGAMAILRNGYEETMESLDDHIFQEEARLATWENRKKMEFARLETLLSQYNNTSTSMNAQIAGLV